jgi:hypothetical protein
MDTMTTFEIAVLAGLAVIAFLLWGIRDAVRKTHDRIVDEKIERMKREPNRHD